MILVTKEVAQFAFSTLALDERLREELTVIFYDILLCSVLTAWFMSEKVNSGFLDWFVECGHFAFHPIHEFHETCSTSVCENQLSCTGIGNVVCVPRE